MGHMLKNTVFRSGSYALGVPSGTSTLAPDAPINGQTRFNTGNGKLEFWANITGTPKWNAVSSEGNVTITYKNLSGDGVNARFGPLNNSYSAGQEAQALVHVGTVYQIPFTNYEFFGNTTIGFKSIPSPGSQITVVEGLASTKATLD
jgi:hypothetical protein